MEQIVNHLPTDLDQLGKVLWDLEKRIEELVGNVCPNSKCIEIYNPPLYCCSVNNRVIFEKPCSLEDYEKCPDKKG